MDNARDLKADSVHFGDDSKSGGLAGNQANKGMLTEAVSEKLGGSRRQAARILDAVLDSVTELLTTKGRVAVKGFRHLRTQDPQGPGLQAPGHREEHRSRRQSSRSCSSPART